MDFRVSFYPPEPPSIWASSDRGDMSSEQRYLRPWCTVRAMYLRISFVNCMCRTVGAWNCGANTETENDRCSIMVSVTGAHSKNSQIPTALRLASAKKLNVVVRTPVLNRKRDIPKKCDVESSTTDFHRIYPQSGVQNTGLTSTRSTEWVKCARSNSCPRWTLVSLGRARFRSGIEFRERTKKLTLLYRCRAPISIVIYLCYSYPKKKTKNAHRSTSPMLLIDITRFLTISQGVCRPPGIADFQWESDTACDYQH